MAPVPDVIVLTSSNFLLPTPLIFGCEFSVYLLWRRFSLVNVPLTWYITALAPVTLLTYAVAPLACPVTKWPAANPDVAAVWLRF